MGPFNDMTRQIQSAHHFQRKVHGIDLVHVSEGILVPEDLGPQIQELQQLSLIDLPRSVCIDQS